MDYYLIDYQPFIGVLTLYTIILSVCFLDISGLVVYIIQYDSYRATNTRRTRHIGMDDG